MVAELLFPTFGSLKFETKCHICTGNRAWIFQIQHPRQSLYKLRCTPVHDGCTEHGLMGQVTQVWANH